MERKKEKGSPDKKEARASEEKQIKLPDEGPQPSKVC